MAIRRAGEQSTETSPLPPARECVAPQGVTQGTPERPALKSLGFLPGCALIWALLLWRKDKVRRAAGRSLPFLPFSDRQPPVSDAPRLCLLGWRWWWAAQFGSICLGQTVCQGPGRVRERGLVARGRGGAQTAGVSTIVRKGRRRRRGGVEKGAG